MVQDSVRFLPLEYLATQTRGANDTSTQPPPAAPSRAAIPAHSPFLLRPDVTLLIPGHGRNKYPSLCGRFKRPRGQRESHRRLPCVSCADCTPKTTNTPYSASYSLLLSKKGKVLPAGHYSGYRRVGVPQF